MNVTQATVAEAIQKINTGCQELIDSTDLGVRLTMTITLVTEEETNELLKTFYARRVRN